MNHPHTAPWRQTLVMGISHPRAPPSPFFFPFCCCGCSCCCLKKLSCPHRSTNSEGCFTSLALLAFLALLASRALDFESSTCGLSPGAVRIEESCFTPSIGLPRSCPAVTCISIGTKWTLSLDYSANTLRLWAMLCMSIPDRPILGLYAESLQHHPQKKLPRVHRGGRTQHGHRPSGRTSPSST